MSWLIGVDVGGPFTASYALDEARGIEHVHKVPSTPSSPADAILSGLAELVAAHGIPAQSVARICHGTTVGTNALIQRSGAEVAVVTTEGFKDLLEIGRQIRPRLFDFQADNPPPLAPRHLRFEIAERIGSRGEEVVPLTDEAIEAIVERVRGAGVDACAVCFLFAFLEPAHERRLGAALEAVLPGLHVSLSSDVQPEFREYERFSTTLLNAYLQPVLSTYLARLERDVAARHPRATVGINQSSGGLMSAERARRFPIRTALSGPAAGVVGAIHAARLSDRPDVITLDMGGTSADVCLIRAHQATQSASRNVADFPVRLPLLDIHTVGAGGGSIAWFDRDGLLKVGPLSAGADPGPACYGLGGHQPTVTDANVVLGTLSPDGLLGGSMPVDVAAARKSIAPLAAHMRFSIERIADGILDIVTANMVRAIRAISVERGHDPRDFTLMPFGGAGALHARRVARELGIREILVPLSPGILCAQGLVVSDLKEDFVRSVRTLVENATVPSMQALVDDMFEQAGGWFEAEGVEAARQLLHLDLDMRYIGQNFELRVMVAEEARADVAPRVPNAGRLVKLFGRAHETSYGYSNPDDPVEIINFRLGARGRLAMPPPPKAPPGSRALPEQRGRRPVYFGSESPVDTPVFERSTLVPGQSVRGPAIIEQLDATIVVEPDDVATVDAALNLFIEVAT
jgi:N-methylhydantoinase A